LIEEAAREHHYGWVPTVLFLSSALTGGAVLRAAGRIFLGWGPNAEEEASGPTEKEKPETKEVRGQIPWTMLAPPAMLVAFAALLGLAPNLGGQATAAAARFHDRSNYAALTLDDRLPTPAPILPSSRSAADVETGLFSAAAAFAVALFELFRNRLPNGMDAGIRRMLRPAVFMLEGWHSGHVGDYVVWLMLGTTMLAALWLATVQLI
jgi:multicomponent Na+:H+ antiporter subunit D